MHLLGIDCRYLVRKQRTLEVLYASLRGIRIKWVGTKIFQYAIGNEIGPNRFLYYDYSFFPLLAGGK